MVLIRCFNVSAKNHDSVIVVSANFVIIFIYNILLLYSRDDFEASLCKTAPNFDRSLNLRLPMSPLLTAIGCCVQLLF
jgi:hypothetical protein